MPTDLSLARELLAGDPALTCVLVRGDTIYRSCERGVAPLLGFLDRGEDLAGFALADKVIGRAAAFLALALSLDSLWTAVVSESAASLLKGRRFQFSYETLTPGIRNRSDTGPCPMEAAVAGIEDIREALAAIRATAKRLKTQ